MHWPFRKVLSISERCSSAWTWANTVAEWHWIWEREIHIYTLHVLAQGSSHSRWALPRGCILLISTPSQPHPRGLFNSVSTTPPSPQVLLELLFTHRPRWVGVQLSKALCTLSQWMCAHGQNGFSAVTDGQAQGKDQGWTHGILPHHHTHYCLTQGNWSLPKI